MSFAYKNDHIVKRHTETDVEFTFAKCTIEDLFNCRDNLLAAYKETKKVLV